ncbi:similar to Saccharomyces cerevisiae YDR143C SAN1 Ubiquitin-protein ligase [Maudiozyma barnettii]|uniref:Similar to Saccharomyces cerevisiae YDR143C SAN1 Ubiquitin-protein ligase n=1 Tax=Maudiozyma barnettii TaxID=61262 RepID=A0A8H2ZK46_9SACH|nr:ubiquitin-protein ligase SAN1 [Kazachstania barnettii]CAB4254827.1 similar to Saccharomyces cerevisiae YDR143C SAN1 Ubiquitin-protein ligase [Kazachstania barnettii]CAD1783015.1 similar to Saccharomyces cerevisiae YDR143C SAN1 Ubiquitin-protein ligase [Kazachstania barnettii]
MSGPDPSNNNGNDSGDGLPANNNRHNQNNNDNNTSNNETTPAPHSNNITLSIQYTYLPIDGTNGQPIETAGTNDDRPSGINGSAATTGSGNVTGLGVNNTAMGTTLPGQPVNLNGVPGGPLPGIQPNMLPTPAGAFVLSFRDIPSTTPQSRLESIVAITAELAMRRFQELHSRPKGIPKEEFEKLPILTLEEVRKLNNGKNTECSICYEPYIEEPVEDKTETDKNSNNRKRSRSGSDSQASAQIDRIKRQRVNADSNSAPTPASSAPTSAGDQSSTNAPTSQEGNPDPTAEDEPTYLHSPVKLPCNHVFGRECIYKWSKNENSCPLCRHKIAELSADQMQNQTNTNNATMHEFERIRNLLYNPPETTENGNTQNTNSNATTPATTSTEFNFPVNGPNIIFLSPDDWNNVSNRATRTGDPPNSIPNTTEGSTTTTSAQTRGVNPLNNAQTPSNSTTPVNGTSTTRTGLRWIPISMRNLNPLTNDERTRSNPGPNGVTNASTSTNVQPQTTEEARYSGLRRLFHTMFSSAEREEVNNAATGATSNTSTLPERNVPPELANHLRNIDSALAGNTQTPASLFSTGVASYRGQNGNVSTFELGNHRTSHTTASSNPVTDASNQSNASNANISSNPASNTDTNNDETEETQPRNQNNENNEPSQSNEHNDNH